MRAKNVVSGLIFVGGLLVVVASVSNVLVDNTEVMTLADRALCPEAGAKCAFAKTSLSRTPLGQTFVYTGKGKTIQVTCRRAFIAVGDYTCTPE